MQIATPGIKITKAHKMNHGLLCTVADCNYPFAFFDFKKLDSFSPAIHNRYISAKNATTRNNTNKMARASGNITAKMPAIATKVTRRPLGVQKKNKIHLSVVCMMIPSFCVLFELLTKNIHSLRLEHSIIYQMGQTPFCQFLMNSNG